MEIRKVAVLITVFNRKKTTLAGLKTLKESISKLGKGYTFDIFLVDDNSPDGTYEAVKNNFPEVFAYQGSGSLYWTRGMQLAWEKALSNDNYDYFLWFNDDGELYADALITLFKTSDDNGSNSCVVTGAFCDHNGEASYIGMDNDEQFIIPNGTYQKVAIMFGNIVLIPQKVCEAVGTMNCIFTHGGGDNEYGFRVQQKGFSVIQTPIYIGVVDNHHEHPYFEGKTFCERWKYLHSPKYSPFPIFYYLFKYRGKWRAIKYIASRSFYLFFPKTFKNIDHRTSS